MHTFPRFSHARICRSLPAVVALIALVATLPAGAADAAYTPTMADLMSVQATIHRYLQGLDKKDNKLVASAFAQDGAIMMISGGRVVDQVQGHDKIAVGGIHSGSPPPSAEGAAGNNAPSPAAAAASEATVDRWHFTANDYFNFESPTRATHYGYWVELTPNGERRAQAGSLGHYEDVFIKQGGQWLILERKVFVGTK